MYTFEAKTNGRNQEDNSHTMIYDNIKNTETYAGLSDDILAGLNFLREASADLAVGVYQLNPRVKAIVSEYETKPVNPNGYEAHRCYIDIQATLRGRERVASLPIERLKETKPYCEADDAALYCEADIRPQEMLIGGGYFAIFFPQDGHMPGLIAGAKAEAVKKVVVKVRLP
mgnify:CR=1 FL=1